MKNLLIIALSLVAVHLFGQNLEGQILDQSKKPLIGAYIIHLQSEHHAHSNEFGNFTLSHVNEGDSLKVMHIGFATTFIAIPEIGKFLRIQLDEKPFQLDEVVVGQNIKNTFLIQDIDMRISPVNSSQEILRKVPGLFIGQHAGGGKAEQIFLRGFDIDHGTDIQISVDGMPVNMVSHAHGQGYADMHFLIPETIENMDFGKGPYFASKGNFGTAGYVHFRTKDKLDQSIVGMDVGQFNSIRSIGMLNVVNEEKQNMYLAAEIISSDGPFDSPQNFRRQNFMAKYTTELNNSDKLSILASHFSSKWNASGQIPERAVRSGLISRFGAIDDTEGGFTSRSQLNLQFNRNVNHHTFITNQIYWINYNFELYSNFTFFLNNPIDADQIRQKENRNLIGFESIWNYSDVKENVSLFYRAGIGLRSDHIKDNELSRTKNRRTLLQRIQYGDVDETNVYAFANFEIDLGDISIQPGLRYDHLIFDYTDLADSVYNSDGQHKGVLSPKLNIIYNYNNSIQLFLKAGMGFHSNDTRVVLNNTAKEILPKAYGLDIGAIVKPTKRIVANVAFWHLLLDQEFVYVGDEGIVEPSGRSRRIGVDFGIRYQVLDWIVLLSDLNYAYARSIDEPNQENFIPLAPAFTSTGGIQISKGLFKGGLQFRYLHDRPATADNKIIAEGYFITDLHANVRYKNVEVGLSVENLFNQEWNETQFATESRLFNEQSSVEEIHFTPGTPLFVKGIFRFRF